MKIRSAAWESPQDWTFEPPDVLPKSSDQGTAGVRRGLDFVGNLVLQGNDREILYIERAIHITHADVQRRGDGMVAHIGRIMTSAARAWDVDKLQVIVESGDPGNVNWFRVEQGLAACDSGAAGMFIVTIAVVGVWIRPGVKQAKNYRCKRSAARISAQGVIDPDKEGRHGVGSEHNGTTSGTIGIQVASTMVEGLGSDKSHLK